MPTVTLGDAQSRLPELIQSLGPGEEILITDDGQAVATLARVSLPQAPRQPGSAVGQLTILSEDEAHLEDFQEYMP